MKPSRLAFYQNRWWRIPGVSFEMYVLSFIDRTSIAMAIAAMRSELHLSAVAIGEAASVFFWGCIVLQIPAGRLAGVWSAKRVIFLQLLAWAGAVRFRRAGGGMGLGDAGKSRVYRLKKSGDGCRCRLGRLRQ